MSSILALSLLLTGGGAQPRYMMPAPLTPRVGGSLLLMQGATTGPESSVFLAPPFLTDAQGKAVPRDPWLNHPLKVVRETASAYALSDGTKQVWLPKRNLSAKAAFPLTHDEETDRLAQELNGKIVWMNGQPGFPCEIVTGYHASVTMKNAQVDGVWRVAGDGLNLSPQGGLVDGGMITNERSSSRAILVVLREPEGLRATAATLDPALQDRSPELMAQAPQRCTTLPALYADADDLRRNLTTSRPTSTPALSNDLDAAEQALIGWTRAQVLAQYGIPNEEGSLAGIMKLGAWQYGGVPYGMILFKFSPEGRVTQASFSRSP